MERATNELLLHPDWELNLRIVDAINSTKSPLMCVPRACMQVCLARSRIVGCLSAGHTQLGGCGPHAAQAAGEEDPSHHHEHADAGGGSGEELLRRIPRSVGRGEVHASHGEGHQGAGCCVVGAASALAARLLRADRSNTQRGEKGGHDNLEAMEKAAELVQTWGEAFLPYQHERRGRVFVSTYHDLCAKGARRRICLPLPLLLLWQPLADVSSTVGFKFARQFDEHRPPVFTPPPSADATRAAAAPPSGKRAAAAAADRVASGLRTCSSAFVFSILAQLIVLRTSFPVPCAGQCGGDAARHAWGGGVQGGAGYQ